MRFHFNDKIEYFDEFRNKKYYGTIFSRSTKYEETYYINWDNGIAPDGFFGSVGVEGEELKKIKKTKNIGGFEFKLKVGDKYIFKEPAIDGYGNESFIVQDVMITELNEESVKFNSFYKNKILNFFLAETHKCSVYEFNVGIIDKIKN